MTRLNLPCFVLLRLWMEDSSFAARIFYLLARTAGVTQDNKGSLQYSMNKSGYCASTWPNTCPPPFTPRPWSTICKVLQQTIWSGLGDVSDVWDPQSAAGGRCPAIFVVPDYTAAGVACLEECDRDRSWMPLEMILWIFFWKCLKTKKALTISRKGMISLASPRG